MGLLCGLPQVVQLLSIGLVSIRTVVDVSHQHAASLIKQEKTLLGERNSRQQLDQSEMRCWRQNRLKLVWEAGLLFASQQKNWEVIAVVN